MRTTLVALPGFLLCLTLLPLSPSTAQAEGHSAPHWTYSGEAGPDHWGDLDPAFSACKAGRAQSPIDLKWKKPKGQHSLHTEYQSSPLKIIDNGHTIQVNFAPGSHAKIGGHKYDLAQVHFHATSEHLVSSKSFPLEAHLVHKDKNGKLAVIGVFFTEGAPHPTLAKIWSNLPKDKGKEIAIDGAELDPNTLLPASRTHYNYKGSLTTPPCSEGVNWNVLNTPLEASAEQISTFQQLYGGNNRPVQPLHKRAPANF